MHGGPFVSYQVSRDLCIYWWPESVLLLLVFMLLWKIGMTLFCRPLLFMSWPNNDIENILHTKKMSFICQTDQMIFRRLWFTPMNIEHHMESWTVRSDWTMTDTIEFIISHRMTEVSTFLLLVSLLNIYYGYLNTEGQKVISGWLSVIIYDSNYISPIICFDHI